MRFEDIYIFSDQKVGGYMPPLDFAMDAGDSLSASNGSEFSSRTDDRTGDGCPGMHDDHPGWYESDVITERFAKYTLKSKISSYSRLIRSYSCQV